jgi:hypothetical protein
LSSKAGRFGAFLNSFMQRNELSISDIGMMTNEKHDSHKCRE